MLWYLVQCTLVGSTLHKYHKHGESRSKVDMRMFLVVFLGQSEEAGRQLHLRIRARTSHGSMKAGGDKHQPSDK